MKLLINRPSMMNRHEMRLDRYSLFVVLVDTADLTEAKYSSVKRQVRTVLSMKSSRDL